MEKILFISVSISQHCSQDYWNLIWCTILWMISGSFKRNSNFCTISILWKYETFKFVKCVCSRLLILPPPPATKQGIYDLFQECYMPLFVEVWIRRHAVGKKYSCFLLHGNNNKTGFQLAFASSLNLKKNICSVLVFLEKTS